MSPEGAGGATIDAVVSHHTDPTRSGVSRFNEVLAEQLGVPVLYLSTQPELEKLRCPLLSFKFSEIGVDERQPVERLLARSDGSLRVFLHDWSGDPLEELVVRAAESVYCGNDEVRAKAAGFSDAVETLWAPGLILDTRAFQPASISVFSFGMAHKVRTDMFRRLRDLLEATEESYALYVSNANHETATLEDARLVYEEMHGVFPRGLYFMGNLSDVAVFNYLTTTTYFAAFFASGARANNTSLASAMEHGAVVITNLDEHSPPWLRHMETVIDINQCDALPSDSLVLKEISANAMREARELGWDRLADRIRS